MLIYQLHNIQWSYTLVGFTLYVYGEIIQQAIQDKTLTIFIQNNKSALYELLQNLPTSNKAGIYKCFNFTVFMVVLKTEFKDYKPTEFTDNTVFEANKKMGTGTADMDLMSL